MNKAEYISQNQYLRKWFNNLPEEDLKFMSDIWAWKINPSSKDSILRLKQVMFHMSKGMSLWELRWLLKAFKTLQTLPN